MSPAHGLKLAAVLAATVLVGGCSVNSNSEMISKTADYTNPPLPAKAVPVLTDSPVPPQSEEQCGNPMASLRPSRAAGPTIDAIRARGRLVVGLDTGTNLFSFRDPITGAVVGFDADIAREVARDLLGSPDLVEFHTLSSADREWALQKNTVDLVAKTMTVTCERLKRVAFSTVYLQANQKVLAMKDSGINGVADLAGKRVCVVPGTTSLVRIRRDQPTATILTVPNWADCLVVLQQRQVDAVSTDDAVLAGLAAQDPYTQLVGDSISVEPYGLGITKGNDDFVRFVNSTLERIRNDGTWDRIYRQWLSILGDSPSPPTPEYQD